MAGELVIRKGGYFGVEDDDGGDSDDLGKSEVFSDNVDECCCCDPCENSNPKPHNILKSWTSNRYGTATVDLKPHKKKGGCFKYWKLAEGVLSWSDEGSWKGSSGSQYQGGSIENGELIGLPDSWTSNFSYDGAMKLFIYCA